MNHQAIKLLLADHWNIHGEVKPLDGYAEQNFLVTANAHKYVLKIQWDNIDATEYEFQYEILSFLANTKFNAPRQIRSLEDQKYIQSTFNNRDFLARLLSWQEGRVLGELEYRSPSICSSLGTIIAENTMALDGFNHPFAQRHFLWDTNQTEWIFEYLHLFEDHRRVVIESILLDFRNNRDKILKLPHGVIHNDPNEANILINHIGFELECFSLIDYGDAIYTATINNVAIALSYLLQVESDVYAVLKYTVGAYHQVRPVSIEEAELLFTLIRSRLAISLTSAAIQSEQNPQSSYHQNNVKGSWKALDLLDKYGETRFTASILDICSLEWKDYQNFVDLTSSIDKISLHTIFPSINYNGSHYVDLSLTSDLVPHHDDPCYEENFAIHLHRLQKEYPNVFLVGGYGEVRDFYVTEAFAQKAMEGEVLRTKHLGVDVWLPANTEVAPIFDGEVVIAVHNEDYKDYGNLLIVKHDIQDLIFYSLYGHLSNESIRRNRVGEKVKQGVPFAQLGISAENGQWCPHLHFQIILDLLGEKTNFDGVASPELWNVMRKICPDPQLLFQEHLSGYYPPSIEQLIARRQNSLGYGLSLSYEDPLYIVRGKDTYLIDANGQRYLDTVNNVAHVGHENFHVVQAATLQLRKLNTNTRYLHQSVLDYADYLRSKFPAELQVIHFVNSGSEANELALRMARAVTGKRHMIAIQHGYHGNTQGAIDISSYKFDAKGGTGKPIHTHLLDSPDTFRGKYRLINDASAEESYSNDAISSIREIVNHTKNVAGFIHESILSCGGQIVLPQGYLKAIYEEVRSHGGIVIADEVQVGFGRVGESFWGFQLQDVVPDIVVMGKPIGNGHPMAAVICTEQVAEAFNNGMEYFNTFGGNPVSAATGMAVLQEIDNQDLQAHARTVGHYIKDGFRELQNQYKIIGDVRGHGLFLGIEFVNDMEPDPAFASHFANAMLKRNILISTDGPQHNVIKIKPPLTFTIENADYLLAKAKEVLSLAL